MITRPITRPVTAPLARAVTANVGNIWNPRALFANGEQGWWFDNNDLSTLFQDAAGTIPVTAAGQPVGRQLDKSGRGNHRYQTTAASRPILRQNATTGAYYFETDGTDDWMQTNAVNFNGTAKVSVFTAVRKLSDAAAGALLELSVNTNTNNGTFIFGVPNAPGAPGIAFGSKGTVRADAIFAGSPAAPASVVLSGIANIGSDSVSLRANGTLAAQAVTDQGTGNYGNHPAYFFRRGGTTLPFSGHEYGSICVGRLCSAAEISAIERMLAQRAGVALA